MTGAFDDRSLIERRPGTVETNLDDEVVLMKLDSGECMGLGATGSSIWRLTEQPTRLAELVSSLRETYEAPDGVIEGDVAEFLTAMQEHGVLEISQPGQPEPASH